MQLSLSNKVKKMYKELEINLKVNGKNIELAGSAILNTNFSDEFNIIAGYRGAKELFENQKFLVTGGSAKKMLLGYNFGSMLITSHDADGIYLGSSNELKNKFKDYGFVEGYLIDSSKTILEGIGNYRIVYNYSPFKKLADKKDLIDVFTYGTGQGSIPIDEKLGKHKLTLEINYVTKDGDSYNHKFNIDSLPHLIATSFNPLSTPLEGNGKRILPIIYILSELSDSIDIRKEVKESLYYLRGGSKSVKRILEDSNNKEKFENNPNYTNYDGIIRELPDYLTNGKKFDLNSVKKGLNNFNLKEVSDKIDETINDIKGILRDY